MLDFSGERTTALKFRGFMSKSPLAALLKLRNADTDLGWLNLVRAVFEDF